MQGKARLATDKAYLTRGGGGRGEGGGGARGEGAGGGLHIARQPRVSALLSGAVNSCRGGMAQHGTPRFNTAAARTATGKGHGRYTGSIVGLVSKCFQRVGRAAGTVGWMGTAHKACTAGKAPDLRALNKWGAGWALSDRIAGKGIEGVWLRLWLVAAGREGEQALQQRRGRAEGFRRGRNRWPRHGCSRREEDSDSSSSWSPSCHDCKHP